MNKLIYLIMGLLVINLVSAINYNDFHYYVEDKVSGSNLIVDEFREPYWLINQLINDDEVKSNRNSFRGNFAQGYYLDDTPLLTVNDYSFAGKMTFNDKSWVEYELLNIEAIPEESSIDPYGMTSVKGKGTLKYKMVVVIEKEIPVDFDYMFYQDIEDKTSWGNEIFINGIDEEFSFHAEDDQKRNTFRHNRNCRIYAGELGCKSILEQE